jgi:NADH-quinone oxidoreductase subunit H
MVKFFFIIVQVVGTAICLLVAVAYVTLLERKVMGGMQQRRGPNVVGLGGLLQPLADGLKLLVKETIIPSTSNNILFVLSPIFTFLFSLLGWLVIPFNDGAVLASFNFGILYSMAVSSCGVYGIIVSGWSSNSKYAFLGALRSAAQMISYEVSLGLVLSTIFLFSSSFNLSVIVFSQLSIWFCIPLFPNFFMFYVTLLAETNRAPFDLAEAEGELVAGYNVEYGSMGFALFFLGEYCSMILMCSLATLCFCGGWLGFSFLPYFFHSFLMGFKVSFLLFMMVWVRATFPRYRYDQLMYLGWKVFLPFSLAWLVFIGSFCVICF